jgi:hypothetical protein
VHKKWHQFSGQDSHSRREFRIQEPEEGVILNSESCLLLPDKFSKFMAEIKFW